MEVGTLIQTVKNEVHLCQHDVEATWLISCARRASLIDGCMAELGVYQGGTAKLICEVKGDKILYLFDTFSGNPEGDEFDKKDFNSKFVGDYETVKKYLKDYPNVHIIRGVFPDCELPDVEYSFVHIDTDSHRSTKPALEYFYPRLVPGGILLIHDYLLFGVGTAIQAFLKLHDDPILINAGHLRIIKSV